MKRALLFFSPWSYKWYRNVLQQCETNKSQFPKLQNFWHPSTQQYVLLNICWYVKSYHFHWIEAWSTRLPLIGIKHSNSEKRLITNLKRSSVLQIIIIYCYTCWSQTFCEKSRNHESNQSEKGWPTHAECCSYIRPSSDHHQANHGSYSVRLLYDIYMLESRLQIMFYSASFFLASPGKLSFYAPQRGGPSVVGRKLVKKYKSQQTAGLRISQLTMRQTEVTI